MFFLNLSLGQFLVLFGAVSATTLVLYLLDRSRRKLTVSTLRFWVPATEPPVVRRRKKIQQPLSLLLQVLSMALLLLAIAQLRWGARMGMPRDHVLILDTSAWMAARTNERPGVRTLMDSARDRAAAYLRSVPSGDRIMLVRADALAAPVTAFEQNRKKLAEAIAQSRPGSTALNLDQAFDFARQIQALGSRRSGEIVLVSAGRVAESENVQAPPNLRVLNITDRIENCGLRKIAVRRSTSDPDVWEIYVSARNYGSAVRVVTIAIRVGGSPAGARQLTILPGAEKEAAFQYRTKAAGLLEAILAPSDPFPDDDRAVLELPPQRTLPVTVYSDQPDLLRPILTANPRVRATFRSIAQYTGNENGLVILDRFQPPKPPAADAIWIEPPVNGSPIPVRVKLEGIPFTRWCSDSPLCAGLRARDLRLASALVFEAAPGDVRIGEVEKGPVIVARPGKPKVVVLGFHPAISDMRYELATPLLFANLLRWMEPEIFRRSVLTAGSVGTVDFELDTGVRANEVRVLQENGTPVPFNIRENSVHFFTGKPGTVRVIAADREFVYSLTLPQLWESQWEPPASAKRGVPALQKPAAGSRDLWPALAVLGALGLLLEWILYGRMRRVVSRARRPLAAMRAKIRKAS